MKSLDEVLDYVNKNEECIFIAYMSVNFNYIAINAYIHKLHDDLGYSHFSGIVINLRNNPNEGHSFEEDSFRFPDYCNVQMVHLYDESRKTTRKRIALFITLLRRLLKGKKQGSDLYILSSLCNPKVILKATATTERTIQQVIIPQGAFYGYWRYKSFVVKNTTAEIVARIIAGNVCSFKPFDEKRNLKRNADIEKFYVKATEEEGLSILGRDPNEKYLLFVSQHIYPELSKKIDEILKEKQHEGYNIYIKPHSHERQYSFKTDETYTILPKGYAVESIVAGAVKKPDMIISIDSSSLFSCSAWYKVPSYSLMNIFTREEQKDYFPSRVQFHRIVRSGMFPDLHFYIDKEENNL